MLGSDGAFGRSRSRGKACVAQEAAALQGVRSVTTSPILIPSLPLLLRAADISSTMRVGVYDCLYVALAEREGCEFITADDKLVKNLQAQFPFIVPLASVP